MINFAPFYKDISSNEATHKKLKRRVGKVDYRKSLRLLHDSFVLYNPNNKFIVQTDEITTLPYQCHRTDLSHYNLIESIIISNLSFVKNIVGKSVLVGVDNIVLGQIDKFFDDEFDIGLFCLPVPNPDEKFNLSNGVVLINSNTSNHDKIVDFFDKRHQIYKSFDPQYKSWWGDMLSLNRLISEKNILTSFYESKNTKKIYNFNGIKIKLFEVNKDHYKWVDSNGYYNKDEDDIILDFPGDNSVKQHAEFIFNSLKE